jgi:WD40 repeat protein
LFQNWEAGYDRLKVYDLKKKKLIELSPSDIREGERHPAFLTVGNDEFEIVFGLGFREDTKSFERLMVRHWPTMQTRELLSDSTLGGAIPTVSKNMVFFAGFKREKPDNIPDLYRFNTSSGELTRLTKTPWEEWRPAIAPDGSIYFIANADGNFDVFSLAPGADQPTALIQSKEEEWDPAVSPDGRWLAYASRRNGSWDIYISPTGKQSKAQRITNFSGDEWDPAWHPKGTLLVFASKQTGESRIVGICPFGSN